MPIPPKPNQVFSAKNILQILIKNKLIDKPKALEILAKKEAIEKRLEKSQRLPVTIIDILVSLKLARADGLPGHLDEDTIFQTLAAEWQVPYTKIDPLKLDLNVVTTTLPRSFAMKHLTLPIDVSDGCLTVATPNPFNEEVMEDISRVSDLKIKTVVSSKSDIIKIINEFYGFKRSIVAAEHQFAAPIVDLGNLEQYVRLKSADELPANVQHVVNAVNHLLSYAFEQRASDIHIEPKREKSMVRMRIDGILYTVYELPKNVHSAVISRIKNLSRMDMSEKRRPQDGRIKTDKGGVEVEIRVSTIPVAFGEKAVLRIMDPDILFQDLGKLGFTDQDMARYDGFINRPHGIVLVCGPTGSGKSTTLYSTLRKIATPEINVTTVEDPIEMVHESFNQIAVQPVIGITFATILRNILRQDPDIIMIGEMRDLETAENAVQAALTGHLVLSTLHTNDAPSSITRLLDLGVPPFLIRATLVGILGQRLVRKVCNRCREIFEMDAAELKEMGLNLNREGPVRLARGKGCLHCRGTGYFGRTAILEVLPYSEALKKMTGPAADQESLSAKAREEGMVSLRENALKKLFKGETTYQEVLRVTWGQE